MSEETPGQKDVRERLLHLEDVIRKLVSGSDATNHRMGYALKTIRDGRLYEADGFNDMRMYCRRRFGLGEPVWTKMIELSETWDAMDESDK
jgi:hypothetical protein